MTGFDSSTATNGGRRYPLEPLLHAAGIGEYGLTRLLGVSGSTLIAYRERGLLVKAADRLAVRLHLHPAEVWPTWNEDALEDFGKDCDECGRRFFAAQRNYRFCGGPCRTKWWNRESKRRAWARLDAERKERRLQQMREYRRSCRAALSVKRRARYAANAEVERARERARYWAKREAS